MMIFFCGIKFFSKLRLLRHIKNDDEDYLIHKLEI